MATYLPDPVFMTRRGVVLLAIIALHVFIAWALATGLARKAIELIAPPIQTDIVEEVKAKNEPPPPPPPEFQRPPVEVPPPDVTIDVPVETAPTTAISNVTTKHVDAPPPRPAGATVSAKLGKNPPATDEYYPAASKRLNEEGSPVVKVCIAPNGKLAEPPTVATSSGSARLDEGALNYAKALRYQPGTEDGKPVQSCFPFRVVFKLTK